MSFADRKIESAARPRRARRRPVRVGLALLVAATAVGRPVPASGSTAPALEVAFVTAALPAGDGSGSFLVPVVIDIGAPEGFALSSGEVKIELRSSAATTNAVAGAALAQLVEPYVLEVAAGEEPVRGLRMFAEFRLPVGRYSVDVVAQDVGTGAAGRSASELRLPERLGEAFVASTALLGARPAGWRLARANQAQAEGAPFPFVSGGGSAFLPASTVEVEVAKSLAAQLLVATPSAEFPFIVAELTPARGGAAKPLAATIRSVAPSAFPGVRTVELELGPIAEAGSWRLRVGLGGADGRLETPLGSTVTIEARTTASAAGGLAPDGLALARDSDLGRGYRRLLDSLVQSGVEVSAPELVRFENAARERILVNRRATPTEELRAAQRAVIAGLDSPSARLPVAALHFAAAELYRNERESSIAAESAQLAAEVLIETAKGSDPVARARATDLLALLRPTAALDVDPDHALALLRMAHGHERGRQYVQASITLERLLRAHPGHPEGNLRAGVVFHRRGELSNAVKHLERALAANAPDWIKELAFSELGAIAEERGQPAEAERWLRQGIAAIEAQPLHLQLAMLLDRLQRPKESVTVMNRMPIARVDGRASARHLYARDAVDEADAARDRIAAAVAAALPKLRVALAASGSTGTGR